ncbi:MAG: hypothetical protein ACLGHN_06590 [Bacteriovoracia bacterium]
MTRKLFKAKALKSKIISGTQVPDKFEAGASQKGDKDRKLIYDPIIITK